jgi:hypothetical protein
MATIRFTEDDRDERGFVKVPPPAPVSQEPRSLADLLPTPQSIQADAQRRPASKGEQAMLLVAAAGLAIVLAVWLGRGDAPAAPQSIPAAPQASGDVTATPSPTAPAVPAVMLPAFAAPDGARLGEIESTRAITPTAHYGDAWIQADVQGSGRCGCARPTSRRWQSSARISRRGRRRHHGRMCRRRPSRSPRA